MAPWDDRDHSSVSSNFVIFFIDMWLFTDDRKLTGEMRNKLFDRGERLSEKEKFDEALDSYLKCIKGLERGKPCIWDDEADRREAFYHL